MKAGLAALLVSVTLAPRPADALPQHAIRSAAACDTCHVQPAGWPNPELADRKCSLSCNTCHVSPTGAGMRNAAGLYYGRRTLATWPERSPAPPAAPAPTSQPTSQPATPAVAAPGTAARYGGIPPHPVVQVGADVRVAAWFPNESGSETSLFPMQTDLHLAARPYNPEALGEGRVTLLATGGMLGARGQAFDDFVERLFVREWWAMVHDLPYQAFARAGRFLPSYGWKTDDHTLFVRQGQAFLGRPLDHERQVTGVEVGLNPNYAYGHLSVFNAANEWDTPVDGDDGWGAAATAGWRDLPWHAGASLMGGQRGDATQVMGGANWALFLDRWGLGPFAVLGQYDVSHLDRGGGEAGTTALATFHELEWEATRGVRARLRYEWQDADVRFAGDHRSRATAGLLWHPVPHLSVQAEARHAWGDPGDAFSGVDRDDALLVLHGWY